MTQTQAIELYKMSELNKNNVMGYLRLNLPSICFRGDNYSTNFLECLDENINKVLENNGANSKKENLIEIGKKEIMLKEVFGSKSPSTSEVKKLKVDKLVKLAQYLDYSLPSPILKQDVKEAREYIVKNMAFPGIMGRCRSSNISCSKGILCTDRRI